MASETLSVVVTGASAGVGRAIARRFARDGARLTLIARSAEGLVEAKRDIETIGGEAIAIPIDVCDAEAVDDAADRVSAHWGGIDIWINNAMVTMFAPVSAMSAAEIRRITEVTYLGTVHGTLAALRHMGKRGSGTIVQVGSALAYRAIPLQSAYCGAKHAVRGFTDALRSELIHDRSPVRLVMVQLPAVDTPQFDWARNVFPTRPQPVPPIFEPEAIAEQIHKAALRAPREMWIGLPTLKIIAGAVAVPGWLDHYLARAGYKGQLTNQPEPDGRADNLFEPSPERHDMRGRFSKTARKRVVAVDPAKLRLAIAALSVLVVVVVAVVVVQAIL